MYRMGNFVTNFFPDDVVLGEDVDMFVLPGIDPEYGKPMLVAGDVFAMLNNTPEARGADGLPGDPPQPTKFGRKGAGFCRRIKQVNPEVYPDLLSRKLADMLTTAEIVRFDGSDSMPGGSGDGHLLVRNDGLRSGFFRRGGDGHH